VLRAIEAHPRLEVGNQIPAGLVVVTDTDSVDQDRADVDWLNELAGVTSACVTFSSVEDVAESSVQNKEVKS
jgi:hypothetical protein